MIHLCYPGSAAQIRRKAESNGSREKEKKDGRKGEEIGHTGWETTGKER
jgi:hypothetical protein